VVEVVVAVEEAALVFIVRIESVRAKVKLRAA
jgi:hypothetical protein